LQQLCGCPLPDQWLHLISNYPPGLLTASRGPDDQTEDGTVCRSNCSQMTPLSSRSTSKSALKRGWTPAGAASTGHPHTCVIGETGDGDYFCIDALPQPALLLQYRTQG
jgi:hypothetical protein